MRFKREPFHLLRVELTLTRARALVSWSMCCRLVNSAVMAPPLVGGIIYVCMLMIVGTPTIIDRPPPHTAGKVRAGMLSMCSAWELACLDQCPLTDVDQDQAAKWAGR